MKKASALILVLLLLLSSCKAELAGDVTATQATGESYSSAVDAFAPAGTSAYESTASVATVTDENGVTATVPTSQVSSTSVTAPSQITTVTKAPTTKAPTTKAPTTTKKAEAATSPPAQPAASELRGIWLSCFEFPSAQGVSKAEYTQKAETIFANIASLGLNAAFVHVRPYSDSMYPSDIFPWSKYVTGEQGKSVGYDPLAILLASAKKHGIAFHAWINPFRVASDPDYKLLSADNPARKIIESGNKDGDICFAAGGIYYCPASTSVHALVMSGVKEILQKYDVDGIHIDDYFYPSTEKSVDSIQYKKYTASGGKLSLDDWRTSSVNSFVAQLYTTVKNIDSSVIVSISPSGIVDKNQDEYYADAITWLSKTGYADLIIPQIYFGFEHPTVPFKATADKWATLKKSGSVKLACGLGIYKSGLADANAGSGTNEWKNNDDIIARQLEYIRKNPKYSGFVLFSYSYVFNSKSSTVQNEVNNLKAMLK